MNGLDSEEHICRLYSMDKVLYGVYLAIDSVRSGNQVAYTKPGVHYFGEMKNDEFSPNILRVRSCYALSQDIRHGFGKIMRHEHGKSDEM